jgi:hypothetical protein
MLSQASLSFFFLFLLPESPWNERGRNGALVKVEWSTNTKTERDRQTRTSSNGGVLYLQRNQKCKKTGFEAYKMSKGGTGSWENEEMECVLVIFLVLSAAMEERGRGRRE